MLWSLAKSRLQLQKFMDVLPVVLLTIFILALWVGSNYRLLVQERAEIARLWTKIEEKLKFRHELVDAFPQVLSVELKADQGSWGELKNAAGNSASSASSQSRQTAENEFGQALGKFMQGIEQNPAVLESESYTKLRDRAVTAEDELMELLNHFNDTVVRFNAQQKVVPNRFFVARMGMQPAHEFDLDGAFSRHPLKFKPTLPTPGKRLFGGAESSDNQAG